TLDVGGHSVRANTVNGFMFGSGPARRFVGDLNTPISAENIHPGGQSGVLGSPTYASQLGRWLTNRYKTLIINRDQALAAERERLDFR
ncbi:MAG: penicillin acylase family protein, partial [Xanthomonadales bacterium]|nr:penicillin acylase family protein [Xanthomonadales bacterium]